MFTWKPYKDKFVGEGIYHLTFTINNRVPLLGVLAEGGTSSEHIAHVAYSELGIRVHDRLRPPKPGPCVADTPAS